MDRAVWVARKPDCEKLRNDSAPPGNLRRMISSVGQMHLVDVNIRLDWYDVSGNLASHLL